MNVTDYSNNKDYTKTPSEELNAASKYGTKVHEIAADMACNNWQLPESDGLNYTDLAAIYIQKKMMANNIKAINAESYCTYRNKEEKLNITGKYDLYARNEKATYIIDYKTESSEDVEGWTIQLNLYRFGLQQAGQQIDKLYVLRVPKKKNACWVEIPKISERELIQKIKQIDKTKLEALIND